jgi:hypothetical protein
VDKVGRIESVALGRIGNFIHRDAIDHTPNLSIHTHQQSLDLDDIPSQIEQGDKFQIAVGVITLARPIGRIGYIFHCLLTPIIQAENKIHPRFRKRDHVIAHFGISAHGRHARAGAPIKSGWGKLVIFWHDFFYPRNDMVLQMVTLFLNGNYIL